MTPEEALDAIAALCETEDPDAPRDAQLVRAALVRELLAEVSPEAKAQRLA